MTGSRFTGRRASRGARVVVMVALTAVAPPALTAQRLFDYTPNTRPAWTLDKWQPAMVLSHRFEVLEGGDELLSIPTITFGTGVGNRIAAGLDFTSNSEVTAAALGGNEVQLWIALHGPGGERGGLSGLLGYNTAAASLDGAVTARTRRGFLSIIAEARAFSDAFGTGGGGFAGAGGAVLHLTPYLSIASDVGKAFRPDTFGTVWTGGITLALPGTRHQFSFHATNGGAATLQGTSRKKALGPKSVRYGFAFIAPLGTGSQWARVFRRGGTAAAAATPDSGVVTVAIRDIAFAPGTVRIKVGQTVVWVNGDPIAHTVTADDKSWGSGFLNEGGRFSRRFTAAGSYAYHCEPHPQMRGIVIVEP